MTQVVSNPPPDTQVAIRQFTNACGIHESLTGGPCPICNPPTKLEQAEAERDVERAQQVFSIRRHAPALLRLARELREIWKDEDLDASVWADLDSIERVGRWLASSTPVEIKTPCNWR